MVNFKLGKGNEIFHPALSFWTEVHRWVTNHMWLLQRDCAMPEDMHAHCRASAKWAFVVKKYVHFNFLRNLPIISLDIINLCFNPLFLNWIV